LRVDQLTENTCLEFDKDEKFDEQYLTSDPYNSKGISESKSFVSFEADKTRNDTNEHGMILSQTHEFQIVCGVETRGKKYSEYREESGELAKKIASKICRLNMYNNKLPTIKILDFEADEVLVSEEEFSAVIMPCEATEDWEGYDDI